MKNKISFCSALLLTLLHYSHLSAQTAITGPECVIPGTEYQYNITAAIDSGDNFQVCVKGGILKINSDSCYSGSPLSSVRVVWNAANGFGHLSITMRGETLDKNVQFTSPLQSGAIDSSRALQFIDTLIMPLPIICSPAQQGSCFPNYVYQWQMTTDFQQWIDIAGANDLYLNFTEHPERTTYYRRKVTDLSSSTTLFSAEAAVFITEGL